MESEVSCLKEIWKERFGIWGGRFFLLCIMLFMGYSAYRTESDLKLAEQEIQRKETEIKEMKLERIQVWQARIKYHQEQIQRLLKRPPSRDREAQLQIERVFKKMAEKEVKYERLH